MERSSALRPLDVFKISFLLISFSVNFLSKTLEFPSVLNESQPLIED